jgi:Amidase
VVPAFDYHREDNYNTADLPTTGGSASLAGMQPAKDALVVARLRAAGAIVLAKGNMQEFALGGTTISSLGGQTLNLYDLTHAGRLQRQPGCGGRGQFRHGRHQFGHGEFDPLAGFGK